MNRLEKRVSKLESHSPPPPSPFDGMTCDELTVLILENTKALLEDEALPADERTRLEQQWEQLCWEITETVNFASGQWATIPGLDNYQEHLERVKREWERVRPNQSHEYVPSLRYGGMERDGFDRPDPVTPDLMARRKKLWAHPIVMKIVKDSAKAKPRPNALLHECASFREGRAANRSDNCGPQCTSECLNVRRPTASSPSNRIYGHP